MNAPFCSIMATAAQAAARLNLAQGRDGVWRGRCPGCYYKKPSLTLTACDRHIAIFCVACNDIGGVAAAAGIPVHLLRPCQTAEEKTEKALVLWHKAVPALGTPVETYLTGRGVTIPLPDSIRYLKRQRNWVNGRFYPAMISAVERVPAEGEHAPDRLIATGVHLTFLNGVGSRGCVQKAQIDTNKLTLGALRSGGVWLTHPLAIGSELAVAEGIETALSVQQITGLPTVAALSAAGMRAFRWPPTIRRLWIAADNDEVGLGAAEALANRALDAGLEVNIRLPANNMNDFNDLLTNTNITDSHQ